MSSSHPGNQESHAPAQPAVSFLQKPAVCALIVALFIGIGVGRIVSTYHVFNHTIDEGAHLACGIQWFQNSYTYDQKHTPIARISIALLPYLSGVRGYGDPSYWQNLTLARVAVLPYYAGAIVVIFLWTKRVYGSATALIAAGIFSMLPVVLAHSAVATTDIPLRSEERYVG